jgi:mono/diheme cytochrome c family protein
LPRILVRARRLVIIGIVAVLGIAAVGVFSVIRKPRLTPALRGLQVARANGCFACHGPGGTGGVANPGAEEEEVPAWDGGNAMMYVKNEEEIREWILLGRPERLAEEHDHAGESEGATSHDHSEGPLPLHMPAFEGVISNGELSDLIAYYKAVAAFETPPPSAREGRRVASRLGCFGCHGPGGRVGSKNPRSFKGYIPPWQGKDYAELVKNDDELRGWIMDGKIDRFESNPLATYFTGRQVIQMPAYRDVLQEGELDAVVSYIHWLNGE